MEQTNTKQPIIIAGPCSAETEQQTIETARQLAAQGIHIYRAGIWKPRTKPGGFEGIGEKGIPWLQQIKKELHMQISTEVATAKHVEIALNAGIDILWIGARTTANPFAVQEIADALRGTSTPILIKNPVNPDLDLWIGSIERLTMAGIKQITAVHRGFSTYGEHLYRNQPQWHIPIELRRQLPQLPIICDPSHMGGKRELIAPLAQQAMDLGYDGLMIETHCDPDNAWSDAAQQITPTTLQQILAQLTIRTTTPTNDQLNNLRQQIDECDNQLIETLTKRMHICRQIGKYKKQHNITILQSTRYDEIINKRSTQAQQYQMSPQFIQKIFETIHEESIRQQIEINNK